MSCTHLDATTEPVEPSGDGCEDCVAMGRDDWVHLRLCMTCGHVGCCDSSPLRHATAHASEADHAVVQSFEPGEAWAWCYDHETMVTSLPSALVRSRA